MVAPMSDAKSPPDPSIDEILATIRRIISEDEQVGAASTGGTVAGTSAAGSTASSASGGGSKTEGATAEAAAQTTGDSDDILELTEALNEDGTTRHLAPIGGASSRRAAGIAGMAAAAARSEPQAQPELPPRLDAPNLRLTPAQPASGQREPRLPGPAPRCR